MFCRTPKQSAPSTKKEDTTTRSGSSIFIILSIVVVVIGVGAAAIYGFSLQKDTKHSNTSKVITGPYADLLNQVRDKDKRKSLNNVNQLLTEQPDHPVLHCEKAKWLSQNSEMEESTEWLISCWQLSDNISNEHCSKVYILFFYFDLNFKFLLIIL